LIEIGEVFAKKKPRKRKRKDRSNLGKLTFNYFLSSSLSSLHMSVSYLSLVLTSYAVG
jgi:hypothetical protein